MWASLTGGLFAFLFVLLLSLRSSSARHEISGLPPVFLSQEEDVIVSSGVFPYPTITANLVLYCNVSGTPDPKITWFRGGSAVDGQLVNENGTLITNVTEGVEASRDGVPYYCVASNTVGTTVAAVRSREILVSYTFFRGFGGGVSDPISTVEGGAVALECDFLDAKPRPEVKWYMNNASMSISESGEDILFLENGRYLFIARLSSAQLSAFFNCEVVNANLDPSTPQRSPTTYRLSENLQLNTLQVYRNVSTVTGLKGANVRVVYAAASRRPEGASTLILQCPDVTSRGSSLVIEFLNIQDNVETTCNLVGSLISPQPTVVLNFEVLDPARITEGDSSLINRERLVGGGSVVYNCENEGAPPPEVRWYYNGEPIPTDTGVSENGRQVVISQPQVSNSGVYQCVVSNTINGVIMEDRREWVLEVREPIPPVVSPLVMTNADIMAMEDRLEGTVIVADSNTNLTITARVTSDPCPTVQWSFRGDTIEANSNDFTFDDPCAAAADQSSPYIFNLTIANLTAETSGQFSAVFAHLSANVTLPGLFVTIPVTPKVNSLDLMVEAPNGQRPSCLLKGSSALLTCNISGFPRPDIFFRKQGALILPGEGSFGRITNVSFDRIMITGVQENDGGTYTCGFTFNGNEMIAIPLSQLNFCTFPNITSLSTIPPNLEMVLVGERLELACSVEGSPLPSVTWIKVKEDGTSTISTNQDAGISISQSEPPGTSTLRFDNAVVENNGEYFCVATNDAGSINSSLLVDFIEDPSNPVLSTAHIIGIAAGGVGLILLSVLIFLLFICVYLCARKGKSDSTDFAFNVDYSAKPSGDFSDGRGNVDTDSFNGEAPEAFDPDYASVPTRRPTEPPPYKDTPGYQHGAPLAGEDLEMIKYPPQDSESFVAGVPPYSRPGHDNGYRQAPNAEDFLSEDAQFV